MFITNLMLNCILFQKLVVRISVDDNVERVPYNSLLTTDNNYAKQYTKRKLYEATKIDL
jgi:hypothetical protein